MIRLLLAAAFTLLSSAALHAEEPSPPFGIYSAVRVVSDYRFNGSSVSNAGPALQGYAHLQHQSGWYAGAFASTVEFNDPGDTRAELDLYTGRMWRRGSFEYRAELMRLAFDEEVPGPTYDFWQGKLIARRHFDSGWVGVSIAFTPEAPYAGGNQAQLKLEGQKTVVRDLRLTGLFGHASRASRPDHDYWELCVEKDWRKFTFMVGRTGSNQKFSTCLDPDWCRDAWVGSVTLRSY